MNNINLKITLVYDVTSRGFLGGKDSFAYKLTNKIIIKENCGISFIELTIIALGSSTITFFFAGS